MDYMVIGKNRNAYKVRALIAGIQSAFCIVLLLQGQAFAETRSDQRESYVALLAALKADLNSLPPYLERAGSKSCKAELLEKVSKAVFKVEACEEAVEKGDSRSEACHKVIEDVKNLKAEAQDCVVKP